MSHWTIYRLRLVNPSWELLSEAVARVAGKLGGRVVYNLEIGVAGRREVYPLAIEARARLYRPLAITVGADGSLAVVGEAADVRSVVPMLEAEYAALAIARAAASLGFQVERSEGDGSITLTLRKGSKVNVVAVRGGSVEVDARGYTGAECVRDADALLSSLPGVEGRIEKRVLKPEAKLVVQGSGGRLLSQTTGIAAEREASYRLCG
ncbi:MAG: hypothetical protein QXR31_05505 [Zestosphaera sp.]